MKLSHCKICQNLQNIEEYPGITKLEAKVIKLIEQGLSWPQIAKKLSISKGYARNIGVFIRRKTGFGMREIQLRVSST